VGFDPASNAALQAQLLARAVAGQFTFTVRAATAKDPAYVDHPVGRYVRSSNPSYLGRTVISWSAVYRSPTANVLDPSGKVAYTTGGVQRTFGNPPGYSQTQPASQPEMIVVDNAQSTVAQGMMLAWIKQQFDLHDQRSKNVGLVPQMHP
jgi:hypothetical protein